MKACEELKSHWRHKKPTPKTLHYLHKKLDDNYDVLTLSNYSFKTKGRSDELYEKQIADKKEHQRKRPLQGIIRTA